MVSLAFAVTALAYAVLPTLEQQAIDRGEPVPASAWREALKQNGPRWLFLELAAMVVFGLVSMGIDRLRSLKKERRYASMEGRDSPEAPGGSEHKDASR